MAPIYIAFKQLSIQLVSKSIHFHESCHSFESFQIMHRIPSHYLLVSSLLIQFFQIFNYFIQCSKESYVKITLFSSTYLSFMSVTFELVRRLLHTQNYFQQLCFDFHVVDWGFIIALLWWDYSCRHQNIFQELVLETGQYLEICMPQWQVSSLSTIDFHSFP